MEFAALRVQEADEEIKRIQQAIADRGGFVGEGARNQLKDIRAYRDEFQRVIDAGNRLIDVNNNIESGGGLVGSSEGTKDATKEVVIFANEIDRLLFKLSQAPGAISLVKTSVDTLTESLEFTTTAFSNLGQQIGDVFANAIVEGENFVDGLKAMGKAILKTLISEAIAHAITNAASAKNVANQVSGGLTIPAFIAAAVGSVKGAFSDIPQLAEGGIAFGPSLVEVGEYSGAGGNPEVIAPLNKLKDMIGGNAIQVYGRISGDDIVISNNRATRDRNRF